MALPMTPASIYRGQWKSLRLYTPKPDEGVRRSKSAVLMVYAVPVGAGVAAYAFDLKLSFGDALIAVMGILAGALIAAFSQLANWRQVFRDNGGMGTSPERWLLDSSISHILAGAYSAIVASILTLLSMAVELPQWPSLSPWIHRIGCVMVALFSVHVVMSILVALPNLYSAYVQINHVPKELNGQDRTC